MFVIHFLSFKGATHAHLQKISMIHKKNRNPLLYLLINCLSGGGGGEEGGSAFLSSLILSYLIIHPLSNKA